jgi:hypothetical protein
MTDATITYTAGRTLPRRATGRIVAAAGKVIVPSSSGGFSCGRGLLSEAADLLGGRHVGVSMLVPV